MEFQGNKFDRHCDRESNHELMIMGSLLFEHVSQTGVCEKHWEGHHDKIAQLLWTGDYVWSSSWGSTIRTWKNKV